MAGPLPLREPGEADRIHRDLAQVLRQTSIPQLNTPQSVFEPKQPPSALYEACATSAGQWGDAFGRLVDGLPVRFVRPGDTERPSWAVYQQERYLGTVHASGRRRPVARAVHR
ncbi:hypothetical protein ADL02_45820 [Streptomyces sp. NRRL WC-3723]|nr:hypothetical protein ADL02_45820 [Streptomyces sp. NRRL WC-3723]